MKRKISALICLFLIVSMFAACSSNGSKDVTASTSTNESETTASKQENTQSEIETTEPETAKPEEAEPEVTTTAAASESAEPEQATAAPEAEDNNKDSVIGQTVTFRNLDITFNSAEVVKAKGKVLAINVTIVNKGNEAVCIGAARTTLTDSTGENKATYGFDTDEMTYITDTEVAPGETLEGYLIYFAPSSSPATLTMDNSYDNEGEILNLVIEF